MGVIHWHRRLDLLRLLGADKQLHRPTDAALLPLCQSADSLIRLLLQSYGQHCFLFPRLLPWSSADHTESFVACSHRWYWAYVFPLRVIEVVRMSMPSLRSSAIRAARRIHPHLLRASRGVIFFPLRIHAFIFFVVLGCVFIFLLLQVGCGWFGWN